MVEIKKVEEKIHAIEDEKKRFIKENNFDEKDSSNQNLLRGRKRNENSNAIMKAIVYLQDQHRDKLSLICRFHCYFTEKLTTKALKKSLTNLIAALNNQYYSALLSDLEKVRLGFQKDIDSYDPEKLDNILQSYSRSQLDQALVERRKGVSDGSDFAQDSYQLLFDEFVQCYPVILSSTYSLLKTTGDGFKYDVLIIDEASQVSMASAIIAMSIAKRIVVVGDLKQLPEIDNEELRPIDNTLIEKYRVPPCFQYSDNNILKAVASCYKEELPFTILTEHYRCQRDIISFSNRRFYNNELICLTKPDGISNHIEIIKTVPGNHARKNPKGTGLYNLREIDEIVSYITTDKTKNIGVITPYRCQAELLQEKLDDRAEVDTIHKFQGRECDEIIFSTVSNSSDDYYHNQELRENFVNNKELLNVAMTRAKHKFVLITSDKIFNDSKGPLGDLVKYIRYETESNVEEGSVKSVFDILYEDYAEVRNQYLLKKHPNEVITEVIFSDVLKRILKNAKYQSLTFVQHLPLKEAIKIKEEYFTPEELKYLRHPWTHLDFAILNRFNNKPVLFIEIDGVSYHEQQKKQHLHDDIKDKALEFSGVKHLRLRTNESQEEAKIEAALCSLL
ncbi:MAG: AAA domain-containing protein [Bacilli bacterium]|jgi:hypothetical protein|nr:AAA domain-containing protein [Bacilli bacterium]